MIQIQLRDGRAVMIEDIQFRIVRGDEASPPDDGLPVGVAEDFTFADIARIALIDGGYEVHGARYGGMPIRVLKWGDTSDITVEFPMPIDGAAEVGKALQASSVIEVARTLPSQIHVPPPR